MRGGPLISIAASGASRWARLVPGLLRHDPLFRYAAIAAALALVFLAARLAQDFAGPGAIPPAGSQRVDEGTSGANGQPADRGTPPLPGSTARPPASAETTPSVIEPSRSLKGIKVAPAPADRFGTLPQGDNAE